MDGSASRNDLDRLLQSAKRGDREAVNALLDRYRRQIKRMIGVRMDPRVAPRLDASDVVQETLIVAARRLDGYLRDPVLPFYRWLRQIAWNCLIDHHRRHVTAAGRSVEREEIRPALSDQSVSQLATLVAARDSGPPSKLLKKEQTGAVREALEQLPDAYREVLVLRHLEQLNTWQTAEVLGITEAAVKMRHLRAMKSLRPLLGDLLGREER